jgi:hypothetical protein
MEAVAKFNIDNAAFEDDPTEEIAQTFERVARKLRATGSDFPIYDVNGNKIGSFFVHGADI